MRRRVHRYRRCYRAEEFSEELVIGVRCRPRPLELAAKVGRTLRWTVSAKEAKLAYGDISEAFRDQRP